MPYVTVGKKNGADIEIYYKDWGNGRGTEVALGLFPYGIGG
jgi:hypothetical protein